MTEHRIKSQKNTDRQTIPQAVVLDARWGLTLNGGDPVDNNGRVVSVTIDDGDELVIGVDMDNNALSDFTVSLTDPAGSVHQLESVSQTDGEEVTCEGEDANDEKTINVKVVEETALPDG